MTEQMDTRQLILDTAGKIFLDHCDKTLLDKAEQGQFATDLWQLIVENGFDQLGTAASGTDAGDLFAFVQCSGEYAVPLPVADTLLANSWQPGSGTAGIGEIVDGEIRGVAWGRQAQRVIGVSRNSLDVQVVNQPRVLNEAVNLAGEPRDTVALEGAEVLTLAADPFAQMALLRACQMAGGLVAVLQLGIQFATERVQFGRPISKFQAIQHSLAIVAAEVAAAQRAAFSAVDALDSNRFEFEVAASKARIGEAVGVVAEQVHQIHGAMGFTHEHRLHHYSRRIWAWRDEWGNEFHWQQLLGAHLAAVGADQAWSFIATRG
ncbi:MAG: acyl-CoA dehydrogenase family protein [Pseudomonadota bacterium]